MIYLSTALAIVSVLAAVHCVRSAARARRCALLTEQWLQMSRESHVGAAASALLSARAAKASLSAARAVSDGRFEIPDGTFVQEGGDA